MAFVNNCTFAGPKLPEIWKEFSTMPDGLEQLWFDYVTELGMSQVGSPDEPPS